MFCSNIAGFRISSYLIETFKNENVKFLLMSARAKNAYA
jgi:hypothetical protein